MSDRNESQHDSAIFRLRGDLQVTGRVHRDGRG
jgi:hypothetical protein